MKLSGTVFNTSPCKRLGLRTFVLETIVNAHPNGQTVATVDEVAGLRFQQSNSNEMATVGMRMMISNNFAPKTRLRMASRLLIMEVSEINAS